MLTHEAYLTASTDGGPELGVDFAPYSGLSETEDGPKKWFPRDALPPRDRLPEYGFGTKGFGFHDVYEGRGRRSDIRRVGSTASGGQSV